MARNDEATKYGGIRKLYFYDKRLYAGCYGRICIWDLDIKSQIFKYKGDFGVNPKFGEVIGFDTVNNFLFFAQSEGCYEAVDINDNYTSKGSVPVHDVRILYDLEYKHNEADQERRS